MFLLLFFSLAQGAVFLYLKNHSSFSNTKWTLLLLESVIAFTTISWYLFSQKPQPKKNLPSKEIPVKDPSKHEKEISSLQEALSHLNQAEESSKRRIKKLEEEQDALREKLLQEESLRTEATTNIERYRPLIFTLSLELEKLSTHIEKIKKHHAIEVRALLGKNEKANIKKSPSTKNSSFCPPVSPLASTLLLLVQCYKGLSLQQTSWPAQEHALLVRRKFFDLITSSSPSIPLAIISLNSPSDCFISPKLPKEFSVMNVHSLITPHTKTLKTLRSFEPYFISNASLSIIAFCIAWENLNDLIAIVPHESTNLSISHTNKKFIETKT